ncbi:pectate lyase family protein [Actinorugispora endophytica]|uniref:Pectate lyase n=1 Tax=Actinorugispora endophytica TaxID=1605990 RepID=A0A4R6V4Q8_9ACTN|nr:pectate lyase [Actinorugispora endophytica]TDQ55321.1 pectate lyase [Actinorugispora endophytica]
MRRTVRFGVALALPVALAATGIAVAGEHGRGQVPRTTERVARQVLGPHDGWAALGPGTTGGSAAADEHVYVVRDYAGLRAALEGGRDNDTPKIVLVDGRIDADTDDQGAPIGCADYADPGYDFDAYLAAYDPAVWGWDEEPSGPLEEARERSYRNQADQAVFEVGSNTTLIGVGDDAALVGAQMMVDGVDNVIVRNISFETAQDCFPQWDPTDGEAGNWNSEFDGVSVRRSTHVWIDHNEFGDGDVLDRDLPEYFGREYQVHDGLLDITHGSDLVTVSYNHLRDHDKTMLIGSTDSPAYDVGRLRVTLHHNKWENVLQRAPRVRYGQVHAYNNHYVIPATPEGEKTYQYSWGVGVESRLYAENNYFDIDPGVDRSDVVAHWKGVRMYESGSHANGRSARNRVSFLEEYNAVNTPLIEGQAGWEPELHDRIDPTRAVPAQVRKAGVGRIL